MVSSTFESFSQNGEDVVLWRALHDVGKGRYIDVGANHPELFSVSMGFYQRGWSGITVEPDPAFAQMQRDGRPRDRMMEVAITAKDGDAISFHVVDGTGLSTLDGDLAQAHFRAGFDTHEVKVATRTLDSILDEASWGGADIHFMNIDTEGSEHDVLEGIDLKVWRPWVLVIESTIPLTTRSTRELWEELVLSAGYQFCLFDGLSCYYVAEEQSASLGHALSYPACALDDYTTREYRVMERKLQRMDELVEQVTRWRATAVTRWATAVALSDEFEGIRTELEELRVLRHNLLVERAGLHQQIDELHRSSSWRVTKPIRVAGGLVNGTRRLR